MSVWEILGLAPTADARAIKRAYAGLLKKVHPEDDPEGFQRLREAYGEALELAKTLKAEDTSVSNPGERLDSGASSEAAPGTVEQQGTEQQGSWQEQAESAAGMPSERGELPSWGEANRRMRHRRAESSDSQGSVDTAGGSSDAASRSTDSNHIDSNRVNSEAAKGKAVSRGAEMAQWMYQLRELYADYARRTQLEAWEQLLGQEQLRNLGFRQSIQSEVLFFLAEHPHLPQEVWQLLDRTFDWTGDELGLARRVPPEFAAFVLGSIRQAAALRFGYLPVHSGFDQDEFLSLRSTGAGLLRSGELREAVEQFDRAYEYFSRDPDLLRLRAAALHLLGEDWRAEEDWKLLVAHFPGERDALVHLADRMLETERASEALRLFQYALDLQPNDPQVLLGLARCYRELERYAEAQQICDLALLLEPSDIELRIRLLDLQSLQVQHLLDLLKRYPGDRDTRLAAGELLYEPGRDEECERVLTEAPLYGLTSEMKALLGQALLRLGREAEAAVRFDEAVAAAEAAGQNGFEARLQRGLYRVDCESWEDAERDLRAAAALATGDNARLWAGLAACLVGLERFGEALEPIERALRLRPCSVFYGTRAAVLHGLKRYEDAREDCERALAYRASNSMILTIKGRCELRTGRYEEAASSLERARDLAAGDAPQLLAALCELYLRQGQYREVLTETDAYTGMQSADDAAAELLLYRGWACRKLGLLAEAREAFVQARLLLPEDRRVMILALDEQFAGGTPAGELLAWAEQILLLDPEDRETLLRKLGLLTELGRLDEAKLTVEEWVAKSGECERYAPLDYYFGVLLLKRGDYEAAAVRLQQAYAAGLRGDVTSLLSIARFEIGETEEALCLAREAAMEYPAHPDYAARLKLMESRRGVPGMLRQLMRRDSRPTAWPFEAEPIPLRFHPRADDFPYDREGMPR
ncbi:hypothetical protein B9G55_03935 [Saccharibacillus sp. O16]|nr:hypothetical protein B9G55_03935 [Saccharibacillus sp. O16]